MAPIGLRRLQTEGPPDQEPLLRDLGQEARGAGLRKQPDQLQAPELTGLDRP